MAEPARCGPGGSARDRAAMAPGGVPYLLALEVAGRSLPGFPEGALDSRLHLILVRSGDKLDLPKVLLAARRWASAEDAARPRQP
jgi:hypothetical protein